MKNFLLSTAVIILARAPIAFNSDGVPTVTIKTDNGPVIMNASDFNEDKHELYEPEEADDEEADEAVKLAKVAQDRRERIAALSNPGVVEESGKFYVVDGNKNNEKVKGLAGINAKGYKNAKSAWDAVQEVRTESVIDPATIPTTA